jgi:hypothetical protein
MTIQRRLMFACEVQFQCGCTVNADLHLELPYKKMNDDCILVSLSALLPKAEYT